MEQHDGFSLWIGGLAEIEDVTIGPEAADDFGTGRGVDRLTPRADRHLAIIADPDASLLAPDIGPPRTGGSLAQNGTVFGQSFGASLFQRMPLRVWRVLTKKFRAQKDSLCQPRNTTRWYGYPAALMALSSIWLVL